MTYRRPLIPTLVLGCVTLAFLAAACGKSASPLTPASTSSTSVPPAVADDVARQFGAALSRQGGLALTDVGSTTIEELASTKAPSWAGKTGPAHVETEGSFTWSSAVTFYDAAGNLQQTFDPITTHRMNVHARAHGELIAAHHRAMVGTDRVLDVTGLLPADTELFLDGAVNDTADCAFESADGLQARHVRMEGDGALEDVRLLKDRRQNPYPLSGTARWHLRVDASAREGDDTDEAHYEVTVVVTFNGTAYPTIEVAERYRYRLNLETGEVEPA
jgi:hypothetical protein